MQPNRDFETMPSNWFAVIRIICLPSFDFIFISNKSFWCQARQTNGWNNPSKFIDLRQQVNIRLDKLKNRIQCWE